jgi:hypothetical protein
MIFATVLTIAALLCFGGMYSEAQIEKEARGFRICEVES